MPCTRQIASNVDPRFIALAEKCLTNTACVQKLSSSQALGHKSRDTYWGCSLQVLSPFAVQVYYANFNSISRMLGKGINYAFLDAIDLALGTPLSTLESKVEVRQTTGDSECVSWHLESCGYIPTTLHGIPQRCIPVHPRNSSSI
jgi:hypothetical protein